MVTAGESHVFADGVSHLLANHADPDPWMHLSTWLPEDELLTAVRQLCDTVFESLRRAQQPGAQRILDKSPNARPYAADLARVYPDARFVHIIRDARDMAGSARDLWGRSERFAAWEQTARTWLAAIDDNRAHLTHLDYHEVRYEELLDDPEGRLAELFGFLDLDHDDEFVAECVAFGRAPLNVRPSDDRIGARKWKGDDDAERRVVGVVGHRLVELGYMTEQERRDAVAGVRPHELLGTLRNTATDGAEAVRRRLQSRRVDAARRTRATVRTVGERMARLVVDGDAWRSRLDGVPIVVDGEPGEADDVGVEPGTVIAAIDADEHACAVQLRTPSGDRILHRYHVADGRLTRIVIQR